MTNSKDAYALMQHKTAHELTFLFISKGYKSIIKAVEYSFVKQLNGKHIYNLAFGDYHIDEDNIIDDVSSNNGDVYKVFNTVLKTIPIFFRHHPSAILMVQGSDGQPGFSEKCKITCIKKCTATCRNHNRRINVYRSYISRNFVELSIAYQFFGEYMHKGFAQIEAYECGQSYNVLYVCKKNNNFMV